MSEQAIFTLQRRGGRSLISATGEIDLANVDEFQCVLDQAKAAAGQIIVDLAKVRYCDSRTLHALARFEEGIRKDGRRLFLVLPEGGPAYRILQVAGLTGRFERFDTLEAALAD